MKDSLRLISILFLIVCNNNIFAQHSIPDTIRVTAITQKIDFDGRLSEPIWQQVPSINNFTQKEDLNMTCSRSLKDWMCHFHLPILEKYQLANIGCTGKKFNLEHFRVEKYGWMSASVGGNSIQAASLFFLHPLV